MSLTGDERAELARLKREDQLLGTQIIEMQETRGVLRERITALALIERGAHESGVRVLGNFGLFGEAPATILDRRVKDGRLWYDVEADLEDRPRTPLALLHEDVVEVLDSGRSF